MGNVYVQKRGKVYQYQFGIASIDGKRKYKNKSGFRTKSEAIEAGVKAYNEYINVGRCIEPSKMSYNDYLDYWMKEHCKINLKYHIIEEYKNIIKNHIVNDIIRMYKKCNIKMHNFVHSFVILLWT